MTPCSIASGLCVGDTNELYYVKPDIARIELLVDFNEAFRLTSCDVCEAITGRRSHCYEAANVPSRFRSCGNSKGARFYGRQDLTIRSN
jgi:hypothetical protein